MPKVSVILTSYNHAKYICEAIDSVLNQSYPNFELIILDDYSTDISWELISNYKDGRIISIRNKINEGPTPGVNRSITELSTGEYIAIHHSDDIWEPEKLEKQVTFLDSHPDIGAVFSQAKIIDEDGAYFLDTRHIYSSIFRQNNRNRFEWLRHFLFHGNCLCHPSALVRRSVYMATGDYDKRLAQIPDFDMWIRMCLLYEIHILEEPLVKFRVRAGEANQSGRKPETMVRGANEQLLVLRNFTKIACEQDLYAIIPELRKRVPTGAPLSYQLAIFAVETDNCVLQAFGLELLYELMSSNRGANELERYGFSSRDLIVLSGRCDFFRSADLFRVESDCQALKLDRQAIDMELQRVKRSFSWQITKPLRFFSQLVSNPKNLFMEVRARLFALLKQEDQCALVPFVYPALALESKPNLAVICHIFYTNMTEEFVNYLLKIPFQCDIYITTDTLEKRDKIQKVFSNWKGKVEIRVAQNRGRDIAPKIITCSDIYDRYEYILHIHTKNSPHNYRLRHWRHYLLETLLGSTEVVNSIFEAFRNSPNLGMIAPQHFEAIRYSAGWGKNFKTAKQIAQRMGIKISKDEPIDFPSGSMFWARTAALRPLLDTNLTIDDFPEEIGQVDETTGHAIERLFYFSCEQAGYHWLKICHTKFAGNKNGEILIDSPDALTRIINTPLKKLIK